MRIKSVKIQTNNMNSFQKERAIESANMSLEFLASDFLKRKLLMLDMTSLRGESSTSISKRKTNQEIYDLLMSGKEEWNDEIDYELDIFINRYTKLWSKVKGYIIPMVKYIYVNSKYFDTSTILLICSNICHELFHMFGFRHSGPFIRESVPYLVNDWVEEYFSGDIDGEVIVSTPPVVTQKCVRVWWKLWLGKVCYTVVSK